ncbi:glutamate racemase [Candidatus Nitrosotenuis chungbukensis]|uniref:glutamate racemase n=1 Tax=Candidatus Nitrosotenuis chungbukensis TaxID=1353246 RepID=UPI0005B2E12A|nr:aspartate/glutamate racemase family protein [Candidatus Nitrosotenuis chungbukensis]
MAKIVVFDSGFGSLSIIKVIQKVIKSDIIYFADQKNFPYGKKSTKELDKIITKTIYKLKKEFEPDLIIMGSNTPSLLLKKLFYNNPTLVGVFPPLSEAYEKTKTKSIAILATSSVIQSRALEHYIKKNFDKNIQITKIDVSKLVYLVESGKFLYEKIYCAKQITSILSDKFISNNIDVATLSSTHLPFLLPLLTKSFPKIRFLDPAVLVAQEIKKNKLFFPSNKNSLTIFSSGDVNVFQKHLAKLRIKNKVRKINF